MKKKAEFLDAYRLCGWVRKASEITKINPSRHNNWLKSDPVYKTAFEEAKKDALEVLEAAAFQRAVHGVRKPTGWYKGQPGGFVTEYSDYLLVVLLKAICPEKYREHYTMDVNINTYEERVYRIAIENGDIQGDGSEAAPEELEAEVVE